MSSIPDFVTRVTGATDSPFKFSICTLVTRPQLYEAALRSFEAKGFTRDCTEYLCVDNTASNSLDAYAAYNLFLQQARGRYIILAHQDIELLEAGRTELEQRLEELSALDPLWGACGNAGASAPRRPVYNITDPAGTFVEGGPFPSKVIGLDENFIIVRREANLALSPRLSGFHYYGAELCAVARLMDMDCYVIDFHLLHKSRGNKDTAFREQKAAFKALRKRVVRPLMVGNHMGAWDLTPRPSVAKPPRKPRPLPERVFRRLKSLGRKLLKGNPPPPVARP